MCQVDDKCDLFLQFLVARTVSNGAVLKWHMFPSTCMCSFYKYFHLQQRCHIVSLDLLQSYTSLDRFTCIPTLLSVVSRQTLLSKYHIDLDLTIICQSLVQENKEIWVWVRHIYYTHEQSSVFVQSVVGLMSRTFCNLSYCILS